jgi:Flp pilus assembly protein TadG
LTLTERRKDETGSALVEFALVAMLFFVMLYGIIDFGRAFYTYHFLSHAARSAARWAMVNGNSCAADGSCNGTAPMNNGPASEADVQNYVQGMVPVGVDPTHVVTSACGVVGKTCAASPPSCTNNNGPGCTVSVTVTYNLNFLAPFVHSGAVPLSSTSEMIIAH